MTQAGTLPLVQIPTSSDQELRCNYFTMAQEKEGDAEMICQEGASIVVINDEERDLPLYKWFLWKPGSTGKQMVKNELINWDSEQGKNT